MSESRSRRGLSAQAGGVAAEHAACAALAADGWDVLLRRARTPSGEVDIVARCGAVIAFIEVKARPSFAEAAHALGGRQRTRLLRAAAALVAGHPEWTDCDLRFDVLLVDRAGQVRRITDAIRMSDMGEADAT